MSDEGEEAEEPRQGEGVEEGEEEGEWEKGHAGETDGVWLKALSVCLCWKRRCGEG